MSPDHGQYGHMSVIGKHIDATQPRKETTLARKSACHCSALRQASRRITQMYDHALAPVGLRVTQLPILATLEEDGPMPMHALAARLVMDRATLGHNLRPLESQNLVSRAVGPDRRSRVVVLTDEGRALLARARPLWRDAQTAFEAAFGPDDARALRTVLARVAALELDAAD